MAPLHAALGEIRDYFENRSDISNKTHGDGSPYPNEEMSMLREVDEVEAGVKALVSALRSSRQYIQLAIIDGKKAGLSEDTLNIARRDLDALDAALASTRESEHG